jgi:glutamine---fructose-6-phosphate transaminase (isomerizing)
MIDYPYLKEIKSQPASLKQLIENQNLEVLAPLYNAIRQGKIDRIILTGMGASYYALYPAWLSLIRIGLPAIWIDASELTNSAMSLITPQSLLWIVSQSGLSAEIISLLKLIHSNPPAALLATVNDLTSPLALAGETLSIPVIVLPLGIETELSVSTRSYVHTIAITQLASLVLQNEDIGRHLKDLSNTIQGLEDYLGNTKEHLEHIAKLVGDPATIVLIGRGKSLASVHAGTLFLGEAAKFPALGFQAGEFRHGPLELSNDKLTVFLFAGVEETMSLNKRLGEELAQLGVNVIWIGSSIQKINSLCKTLPIPEWRGIGLNLAEIVPIQLLSIYLAELKGIEPGKFIHIGKITMQE